MKKLIILALLFVSFQAFSQESVLLRLNYTEGTSYSMEIEQNQTVESISSMKMTMKMDMKVAENAGDVVKTESKVSAIAVEMTQGEMATSYDSSNENQELDQMGQMLKNQFDPILSATIFNSYDKYGNTTETKVEPAIPGMEQMTSSTGNIAYPEEKISVGYTWSSEENNQGMTMKTIYTVSKIENGMVYLDISGEVSGVGTGTIKGNSEIEISTGFAKLTSMVFLVQSQGMNMSIYSKISAK